MRYCVFTLLLLFLGRSSIAQKIESIHVNLYTDSLKKGFYNYINIDGKDSEGNWHPLDTTHIAFVSNGGFFKGNDLFIDSSYSADTVLVKVFLKNNPHIKKEVTIYIRKRPFTELLRTDEDILGEIRSGKKKKSK